MTVLSKIIEGKLAEAKEEFYALMEEKRERLILEAKKKFVAETYQDEWEVETLEEGKRFNIVRVRIRKGKVERRRKVSNLPGYTFRKKGDGPAKMVRMSPIERRKRKISQRRGAVKRRGKMARIQQKMKRVRLKRRSLGLGSKNKVY
jgi:hypothetical protein